jgi:hypothetical protein
MKLLFPSHPLKSRQPDPDYASEAAAAADAGFECEFYDLERLREADASGACRLLDAAQTEERSILHRGWMMTDKLYADLHTELVRRGYDPVVTPDQYAEAHYLPLAYEKLKSLTPESDWIIGQNVTEAWTMYERFRSAPALVKDFVKSAKHKWSEACFIPANTSESRFSEIIHAFLQARGDQFNKGIVLRRFHELDTRQQDGDGQPIHEEFRMFFWKGNLLAGTPAVHGVGPFDMISTWTTVARRFQSSFISMDVARQVDGAWIIIEVGDGGVSGLPETIDPIEFYRALRRESDVP